MSLPTFRQISPSESDTVQRILQDNARWMETNNIDQWTVDWIASLAPEIEASVADGKYWCLAQSNELLGIVEITQHPEALWQFDDSPAVYLHKLAVNRQFNRKGVGSTLLRAAIEHAKQIQVHFVRFDCVASNTHLRTYYTNQGFTYITQRPHENLQLALFEMALPP